MPVLCWLCFRFTSPTLKGVIRHIGCIHAHEANFFTYCGVNSCSRSYTNFYSFKKHLYRHHRCELDSAYQVNISVNLSEYTEDNASNIPNTDSSTVSVQPHGELATTYSPHSTYNFSKRMVALFLLKAKEIHKVSQKSLDGIIADFTTFINLLLEDLQCEMKYWVSSKNYLINDTDLYNIFQKFFDPFNGMNTRYLQEKYFRETLQMLVGLDFDVFMFPFLGAF